MTAQRFHVDGQTYDGYQIGQRLLCRRCGSRLEQRSVQDESGAWQYGVWHCRKCKRPVEATDLVAKPAGLYPIGDETYTELDLVETFVCARCNSDFKLTYRGGFFFECRQGHRIYGAADVRKPPSDWEAIHEQQDYMQFEHDWRGVEMPIKDRKLKTAALSRAGMIRLGVKVPVTDSDGSPRKDKRGNPMSRPADVDYFVLTDAPAIAEAYAGYKEKADKYGAGPTELLVYLPFSAPEMNFDANYEWWQAGGCYCRGDGEFVQRAWNRKGVDLLVEDGFVQQNYRDDELDLTAGGRMACSGSGETRLWPRCRDCRISGVLRVLVRDPNDPRYLVGNDLRYYQIRTHSPHTCDRLTQQIAKYAAMAARFNGELPGIPFRLLRVPETMSYVAEDRRSGDRYRTQSDHALMALEPGREWVELMMTMMHASATSLDAPSSAPPAALPAGGSGFTLSEDEDPDDPDGCDHAWKYEEGEVVAEGEFTDVADEPPPQVKSTEPSEPPARNAPQPMPPPQNGSNGSGGDQDRMAYWRDRGRVTLAVKQQSDMNPRDIWAQCVEMEAAGKIDAGWDDDRIANVLLGLEPAGVDVAQPQPLM